MHACKRMPTCGIRDHYKGSEWQGGKGEDQISYTATALPGWQGASTGHVTFCRKDQRAKQWKVENQWKERRGVV